MNQEKFPYYSGESNPNFKFNEIPITLEDAKIDDTEEITELMENHRLEIMSPGTTMEESNENWGKAPINQSVIWDTSELELPSIRYIDTKHFLYTNTGTQVWEKDGSINEYKIIAPLKENCDKLLVIKQQTPVPPINYADTDFKMWSGPSCPKNCKCRLHYSHVYKENDRSFKTDLQKSYKPKKFVLKQNDSKNNCKKYFDQNANTFTQPKNYSQSPVSIKIDTNSNEWNQAQFSNAQNYKIWNCSNNENINSQNPENLEPSNSKNTFGQTFQPKIRYNVQTFSKQDQVLEVNRASQLFNMNVDEMRKMYEHQTSVQTPKFANSSPNRVDRHASPYSPSQNTVSNESRFYNKYGYDKFTPNQTFLNQKVDNIYHQTHKRIHHGTADALSNEIYNLQNFLSELMHREKILRDKSSTFTSQSSSIELDEELKNIVFQMNKINQDLREKIFHYNQMSSQFQSKNQDRYPNFQPSIPNSNVSHDKSKNYQSPQNKKYENNTPNLQQYVPEPVQDTASKNSSLRPKNALPFNIFSKLNQFSQDCIPFVLLTNIFTESDQLMHRIADYGVLRSYFYDKINLMSLFRLQTFSETMNFLKNHTNVFNDSVQVNILNMNESQKKRKQKAKNNYQKTKTMDKLESKEVMNKMYVPHYSEKVYIKDVPIIKDVEKSIKIESKIANNGENIKNVETVDINPNNDINSLQENVKYIKSKPTNSESLDELPEKPIQQLQNLVNPLYDSEKNPIKSDKDYKKENLTKSKPNLEKMTPKVKINEKDIDFGMWETKRNFIDNNPFYSNEFNPKHLINKYNQRQQKCDRMDQNMENKEICQNSKDNMIKYCNTNVHQHGNYLNFKVQNYAPRKLIGLMDINFGRNQQHLYNQHQLVNQQRPHHPKDIKEHENNSENNLKRFHLNGDKSENSNTSNGDSKKYHINVSGNQFSNRQCESLGNDVASNTEKPSIPKNNKDVYKHLDHESLRKMSESRFPSYVSNAQNYSLNTIRFENYNTYQNESLIQHSVQNQLLNLIQNQGTLTRNFPPNAHESDNLKNLDLLNQNYNQKRPENFELLYNGKSMENISRRKYFGRPEKDLVDLCREEQSIVDEFSTSHLTKNGYYYLEKQLQEIRFQKELINEKILNGTNIYNQKTEAEKMTSNNWHPIVNPNFNPHPNMNFSNYNLNEGFKLGANGLELQNKISVAEKYLPKLENTPQHSIRPKNFIPVHISMKLRYYDQENIPFIILTNIMVDENILKERINEFGHLTTYLYIETRSLVIFRLLSYKETLYFLRNSQLLIMDSVHMDIMSEATACNTFGGNRSYPVQDKGP
ncbi:hypothetical protein A3Q56_04603 [Intoshia linei]|uniref:Uncharacterized protein n=1 Tax=Intoshia linei TaxID=1819745 RepID=A0A177B084_9BILA|nr:hypothetical protein A3Q56_04603 [Intoshia linei]